MNIKHSRIKQRFLPLLLVLVFLTASWLSLTMMHADPSLKMGLGLIPEGGCAMALMADAPCLMSINDHLEMWQRTFTAILTGPALLLLVVLFSVLLMTRWLWRLLTYDTGDSDQFITREHYKDKNPLDKIFSYWEQLFASGILHTRVYA